RQLLHGDADIGRTKVESATAKLRRLRPEIDVRMRPEAMRHDNAADIVTDVDLVIDATDGVEAKFLINDVAVEHGIAFCHAGALGWGGQVLLVAPGLTPCLRCLFPGAEDGNNSATCSQAGIVGPLVGMF